MVKVAWMNPICSIFSKPCVKETSEVWSSALRRTMFMATISGCLLYKRNPKKGKSKAQNVQEGTHASLSNE